MKRTPRNRKHSRKSTRRLGRVSRQQRSRQRGGGKREEEILNFLKSLDDEKLKNFLNSVSFKQLVGEYDCRFMNNRWKTIGDVTFTYDYACMPKKGFIDRLLRDKEYGRAYWCNKFESAIEIYKNTPGYFSEQVPGPSPEEQASAERAEEARRTQQQEEMTRRFAGEMQ